MPIPRKPSGRKPSGRHSKQHLPAVPTPKGMLDAKERAKLRENSLRRLQVNEERIVKQALSDSPSMRVQGIRQINQLSNAFLQKKLLKNLAVDESSEVRLAANQALHELGFS